MSEAIPQVIGYNIDKATKLLADKYKIIIKATSTPFEDKKIERAENISIVVKQEFMDNTIILTTSLFK